MPPCASPSERPGPGPAAVVLVASLAALGLAACGSRASSSDGDGDVDAGWDADADQDGAADADADVGGDADGDRDMDGPVDSCPGPRHGRAITFTNSSAVVQHFDVEEPLALSRQTSGGWEGFIAWASCATVCAECEPVFCEPCDPTLRALQTGEFEEHVWSGQMYLAGDDLECDWEGTTLSCIERVDAPAGRYRVELCHSPDFVIGEEQFGSCHGTEGYVSPATVDSPSCVAVEFDYDPCEEGSVEIVMTEP